MIEKLKNHKIEILCLGAILLTAGFFYFYHITQKGLLEWDEGYHLMVSESYVSALKTGLSYVFNPIADLNKFIKDKSSEPVYFSVNSRPILIFLDAAAFLFFGKNDYVAFAANGIASLIAIVILYFLAKFATGDKYKALLSAFLFAISGHQVFFARTAVAQISAGCLILIMALFYIKTLASSGKLSDKSDKKNLILFGVFAALAFLAHPSVLVILFLTFIFEIFFIVFWGGKLLILFLKRFFYYSFSFAAILLSVEILFRIRNFFLIKFNYPTRLLGFFSDLLAYFKVNTTTGLQRQPMFYIEAVKNFNGWPFLVLFLIALGLFFYKKWYRNPALSFLFIIPPAAFLAFGLNDEVVARIFAVFGGFTAFVAAMAVYEILIIPKYYRFIGWGLIFFFLFVQLQKDWQIINLKTGYKEAADFIYKFNIPTEDIYSESWPVFSFYLNKKVQIADNPKIIYYISDWHPDSEFEFNTIPKKYWELLASFDNPIVRFPGTAYELGAHFDDKSKPDSDKIKIYKIKIR